MTFAVDLPYQPPFDFELPDYRELGKALRQAAFSVAFEDPVTLPEPSIPSEIFTDPWGTVPLPEIGRSTTFEY